MSRAQAESVIKNIIREIAQECASKGQAVSETLVAFMVSCFQIEQRINSYFFVSIMIFSDLRYFFKVKAVVLDPANEFNVDRTLTKDDVQKLIRVSTIFVYLPSLTFSTKLVDCRVD